MKRKDQPLYLRIIGSVASFALVAACLYVFFAGFSVIAGAVMVVAMLSIGGPVAVGGEGLIDVFAGIVEAFIQGIASVFEAIASAFSF